MATLTIEGVPDLLVSRLAAAAAASGRCVNGELIVLLARGLPQLPRPGPAAPRPVTGGPGCRCLGASRRGAPEGWGGPAT